MKLIFRLVLGIVPPAPPSSPLLTDVTLTATLPRSPSPGDRDTLLRAADMIEGSDFWPTALGETLPFVMARQSQWNHVTTQVAQRECNPGPSSRPSAAADYLLHMPSDDMAEPASSHPTWDRMKLLTEVTRGTLEAVQQEPALTFPYYSELYTGSLAHMESVADMADVDSQNYRKLMELDVNAINAMDGIIRDAIDNDMKL